MWLDRSLGAFESYRAFRRKRNIEDPEYGESVKTPEFPKWRSRTHSNGWYTMYTKYKGTHYSLQLHFREHVHPSFSVELDHWIISSTPNAHYSKTGQQVFDQYWSELEETLFYTREEAEKYFQHIVDTFEDRLMENAL